MTTLFGMSSCTVLVFWRHLDYSRRYGATIGWCRLRPALLARYVWYRRKYRVFSVLAPVVVLASSALMAALNLVIDFHVIEDGARQGAPKKMEWQGAFSLLVTQCGSTSKSAPVNELKEK